MPARNALRRRILLITMTAAAATVAATATWLALRSDPDPDQLAEMSAIGEAFGTISAALSAIALIGIATSLYFQRQQTQVARNDAVRTMRLQLLQLALDNPRYLAAWGFDPDDEDAGEVAYTSLVFAYLKMSYVLGALTEYELIGWCRLAFRQEHVAAFWRGAREAYQRDASSAKAVRFTRLIDSVYDDFDLRPQPMANETARRRVAEAQGTGLASKDGSLRAVATITFAAGLAAGFGLRTIAAKRQANRSADTNKSPNQGV